LGGYDLAAALEPNGCSERGRESDDTEAWLRDPLVNRHSIGRSRCRMWRGARTPTQEHDRCPANGSQGKPSEVPHASKYAPGTIPR
jgi:hypothetical protein